MGLRKFLVVGMLTTLALSGCRFKGGESFASSTTPQETFDRATSDWKGDPYASSGIAEATGGLKPATQYSEGARSTSDQKTDPFYNRPEYGSGTRPGELGTEAAPGHAFTNAPSLQGGPNTGNTVGP